jgi:tRNA modification GTPase
MDDVIAAIMTPPGEGGIGGIRISGRDAWVVAAQVLRSLSGKEARASRVRHLYTGQAVDPISGVLLDQVTYVRMEAPHSFTGENTVEVFGHGGPLNMKRLMAAFMVAGARPAEAGEFSKRAFLNGRLDLTQAEAIVDLISAKSERGLQQAIHQLQGGLTEAVGTIESALLLYTAALEAQIDFPEDEVTSEDLAGLRKELVGWRRDLKELERSADAGRLIREGILVAIIGPPNVGKSSLLNALMRYERAIVTEIPGTTRDPLEEYVNLQGFVFRLTDTAGIHETDNPVERIGIQRSMEYLRQADAVLLILDAGDDGATRQLSPGLGEAIAAKEHVIIVLNKADLPARIAEEEIAVLFPGRPVVKTSILRGEGLGPLQDTLINEVFNGRVPASEGYLAVNERHKAALGDAVRSLEQAEQAIAGGLEPDLIVTDLRAALNALGRISGKSADESIVEAIFSHFCVGK